MTWKKSSCLEEDGTHLTAAGDPVAHGEQQAGRGGEKISLTSESVTQSCQAKTHACKLWLLASTAGYLQTRQSISSLACGC